MTFKPCDLILFCRFPLCFDFHTGWWVQIRLLSLSSVFLSGLFVCALPFKQWLFFSDWFLIWLRIHILILCNVLGFSDPYCLLGIVGTSEPSSSPPLSVAGSASRQALGGSECTSPCVRSGSSSSTTLMPQFAFASGMGGVAQGSATGPLLKSNSAGSGTSSN